MTSMQRVLTTLGHREPDRVPLFLLPTLHAARMLGLPPKEYFSKPENVAEGQLRILARFNNDCVSALYYGPIEVEAMGGEVLFFDDGPPNSGAPFIERPEQIRSLVMPDVTHSDCLRRVLTTIEILKARLGDAVPILGVAMSPFSLPVMQMGFGPYIELIHERPELFERLMAVNEEFCVQWANAQLAAGAAAVVYFDPVSSPTMIPADLFRRTGLPVARRTIARIKGATAIHFASGAILPIAEDLFRTGIAGIGVSAHEDLAEIKRVCRGKLSLIGNLNGIEMRRWSAADAEGAVKAAIAAAGAGGGFILSDNHGEIPSQAPEEILMSISEAVAKWGRYPLDWIAADG